MATRCKGPHWVNHTQGNLTYSLAHLQPSFFTRHVPAKPPKKKSPGRAALTAKVYLHYSHHCFSQSLERQPNANPLHYYTCETRDETRVFCPYRWTESKALPIIVTTINTCHFTRHHNFFVIRNPTNPALGDYFIYFSVAVHNSGNFIELEVESAYQRTDAEREKDAETTTLNTLIVNALRGRQTHRP